jgi:hypothetical protein
MRSAPSKRLSFRVRFSAYGAMPARLHLRASRSIFSHCRCSLNSQCPMANVCRSLPHPTIKEPQGGITARGAGEADGKSVPGRGALKFRVQREGKGWPGSERRRSIRASTIGQGQLLRACWGHRHSGGIRRGRKVRCSGSGTSGENVQKSTRRRNLRQSPLGHRGRKVPPK